VERYVVGAEREEEEARARRWPIVAIMLVAAAVRLAGVGHGLPYAVNLEEERNVRQGFEHTVFLFRNKLVPEDGSRSALPGYLLGAEYGAVYAAASLFDRLSSLLEYRRLFLVHPGVFIVMGRLSAVAFGLLSVYLVYFCCAKAFDWGAGVMAAALMALSAHHVHFSRVATGDVFALTFALGGLYFLLKTVMEKGFGSVLYAAFLLGMAAGASFEYVAFLPVLVIVYLVVIPFEYTILSSILGLVWGALAFVLGAALPNIALVIAAPAVFPREFAAAALSRMGVFGLADPSRVREIFGRLASLRIFGAGIGWGLLGAGTLGLLAGLALARWHRRRYLAVFLFAAVPAVLLFPADGFYFKQWALTLTPALAIGAGTLLYRLFWRPRMPATTGVALMMLMTAAVAAQGAAQTVVSTIAGGAGDTRVRHAHWAREELPDAAAVLATPGGRFLHDARVAQWPADRWEPYRKSVLDAWGHKTFTVVLTGPYQLSRRPADFDRPDYVVVDSWSERRMRLEAARADENLARRLGLGEGRARMSAREITKIDQARTEGRTIKVFEGPAGDSFCGGPTIEVIKMPAPEAPAPAATP